MNVQTKASIQRSHLHSIGIDETMINFLNDLEEGGFEGMQAGDDRSQFNLGNGGRYKIALPHNE